MKKIFLVQLVIICLFSFQGQVFGQIVPVKKWDRTFGGTDSDMLTCLQPTPDGGFIFGGYTAGGKSGDKSEPCKGSYDYWIVKTDSSGNKLWDRTFGGNEEDVLVCILPTEDGGYLFGGNSRSDVSGDKTGPKVYLYTDYWLVKTDGNGNKLWDKTFGGFQYDMLFTVIQTADGGFMLGGTSTSGAGGDKTEPNKGDIWDGDFWIVKTDSNGNKQWDKTIGGDGVENFRSLIQTPDDGYLLAGFSASGISGDKTEKSKGMQDFWVVKLDSVGNKQWDKTIGGDQQDELNTLLPASDGGYIVGGVSNSGISGDKTQENINITDYWVVKLSPNGNKIWDQSFGGDHMDDYTSMLKTPDNGFLLGGSSSSGISGSKTESSRGWKDFWVVKLDSTGKKKWDKTIGGNAFDYLFALAPASNGEFLLAGNSDSQATHDKTAPNKGGNDYWVVKLGMGFSGQEPVPAPEVLNLKIGPNPSGGKLKVQLNDLTSQKVEITITNLSGRIVKQQDIRVIDKQVSEWIELPQFQGIYMLQIKADDKFTNCKVLVE